MGQLPQDGSDTTAHELPFLGSQGATYKRYDRGGEWKNPSQWMDYMHTAHSLELLEEKIVSEWSKPEIKG